LSAGLRPDQLGKLTCCPNPSWIFGEGGKGREEGEGGYEERKRWAGKGRGPQPKFCGRAAMLQSTALRESIAEARPTLVL